MNNNRNIKKSRVSPQIAIIALLALAVGASGVALLFTKSEPTADAFAVPRAIRVERVDGNVAVARALDGDTDLEWAEATRNTPLSVGDRIYAQDGSRAMLAFTGRNFARLDPGTSLDVLSLSDRRTQLAMRDGSAIFDLADLAPDELFEIATPNGAIDFDEPGLYQVGFDDGGNTMISVLSGLAEVVGLAGSGEISKGEILTLAAATVAPLVLSKLAPDLAGDVVDDYYGYRYNDSYDGRYRDYDTYLDDPFYYDPYRRSVSYQRIPSYNVPGVYDLDHYGDWVDVDSYGECWSPRVNAGWAPYQNGYWDRDDVRGPTWVSNEDWGWAPYHYGRWAYVNNSRWVWVPDRAVSQPVYSPALVAFVPLRQTNQIAWVPLAPGEQYVPRYYDSNFQPQYLASPEVVSRFINAQRSYANIGVPQAVAVVPADNFYQEVVAYRLNHASPQLIAQSQPVLDPFAIESLRQARKRGKAERRMMNVSSAWEQRVLNTPVVASAAPVFPSAYQQAMQAFQVSPVTEKQKKRKLKFDDSGQVVSARRPDGLPRPPIPQPNASAVAQERGQRIAALATQAAQGDRAARREMKKLERQQHKQEKRDSRAMRGQAQVAPSVAVDTQRMQRKEQKRLERQQRAQQNVQQSAQQGSSERAIRKQRKQQKRLERQQRGGVVQQQSAAAVSQQSARNKQMRRQAETGRAQPQAADQSQLQREQRKAQKRAERQQRQAAEQRVVAQPNYQQKQAAVIQQAEKAQRQQRKAERRAIRQQSAQQGAQPQYQSPQVYQRPAQQQPAAAQQARPDRSQRKAEKLERKAARGKQ